MRAVSKIFLGFFILALSGCSGGSGSSVSNTLTQNSPPTLVMIGSFADLNGGVYGNIGDHTDQSPMPNGAFPNFGAILDLDTIDSSAIPTFAYHQENDPVVPCYTASEGSTNTGLVVSGSCDFMPRMQAVGVPAESYIVTGGDLHGWTIEDLGGMLPQAAQFFKTHVVDAN